MSMPEQQQTPPGTEAAMDPRPDHGEQSYRGSGRLAGKKAVVTGADSGIGEAVAIACAREGADVLIGYLDEHEDAEDTRRWVTEAGRQAALVPGDLADPAHCRAVIARAVEGFGRIDVLVSNASTQRSHTSLEDISDEEWDMTLATNLSAFFHLTRAAVPHNVTEAGIANMAGSLAGLLAEKGIRANSVAPGPIWTPLIPATTPAEQVAGFGQEVPLKRPGQPVEVVPPFAMLASDEASYISGARIAVTGGTPIL